MEDTEKMYNIYLGLAESWGFKPLSYDEWLEQEKKYYEKKEEK